MQSQSGLYASHPGYKTQESTLIHAEHLALLSQIIYILWRSCSAGFPNHPGCYQKAASRMSWKSGTSFGGVLFYP